MLYNNVSINEMCNGHILQVNIQSYELQNNKWQASVVHINKTWCDFLTSYAYFMEGIIRQSNYPAKCPIKAVSSHTCYPHFISVCRLSVMFVATELARQLTNR
jgi:phage terminase large subunit-like protein